jgi:hypothetical protein
MKRVRYLAGVVGLAPTVLGTMAGAGAHATDVTGHGKTVAPYAFWAHQGAIPDITSENCGAIGQHWLRIAYGGTDFYPACFGQGGAEGVNLSRYDFLSTGNNKVFYTLYYHGRSISCNASHKSTTYPSYDCADIPEGGAKLIYIDIY